MIAMTIKRPTDTFTLKISDFKSRAPLKDQAISAIEDVKIQPATAMSTFRQDYRFIQI